MRPRPLPRAEEGRIKEGHFASDISCGCDGAFVVFGPTGRELRIIASKGDQEIKWEHVSVSTERHIPNWQEMCFVKDLFWEEEECVIQYHPPWSLYINIHPHTLHMWRPLEFDIPLPPSHAL